MDLEVDFERGVVEFEGREVWVRAYPLPIDYEATRRSRAGRRVREFEERLLRRRRELLDPARRPRGPLQERPARLHRLRHLPRAAPGVRRADHVHRPAHAVPYRRARVRGVPGEDRGAGRRGQPPPRHAGLDADRPQAARRPRRGRRLLQALRRDDGQRDVRRDEPRGQGRAAGQRAQRRLDPGREHRRPRGAGRVRAVGQPVRRPGAGRRDPLRPDDDARTSASAARAG